MSYFVYGMTYYTGFADMLYRYTEGKTDLMEQEKCRQIALFQQKCFFPSGRTLSFSDGDSRDKYKMGLTCFLAMRYAGMEIPPVSCAGGFDGDSCYRFMANLRDVLWTQQYLERAEKGTLPQAEKTGRSAAATCLPMPSGVSAKALPAAVWRLRAAITESLTTTMTWEAFSILWEMKCC